MLTDDELLDDLKKRFIENKKSLEELQILNQELIVVNKKLEESEALKSHFISNITNEIINPFSSILGLSKAILSVDKENWKKVISMIAMIHSEAFNLDFQFKNIFAAAKIEAGEIAPEILKVDVKSLLESVIESFKFEARKKNLTIKLNFDIKDKDASGIFYFKTDPEKLKQILSNLLSNAINFSFDDKTIDIRCWMKQSTLYVEVRDYGTGISEENQKIIFDRFKRLDSGINSLNRGHGLGLSVNKALLDLLDGEINIKSKLDQGAAFIIKLPESTLDNIEGYASDGNEYLFNEDAVF